MDRMVYCNVGWMNKYQGLAKDKISGGGQFVSDTGYGHEMFNFLPHKGFMYGYVQPTKETIRIERLGADTEDSFIENILVVWVAKQPAGGSRIVGWYQNATVYKDWQPAPNKSNRKFKGESFGFYIKAKDKDCKLLSVDNRNFEIPRTGNVQMGNSNVWYADQEKHVNFNKKVQKYISSGGTTPRTKRQPRGKSGGRQPDPYLRQKVEKEAIKETIKHYNKLGYAVDSVEKENLGWDLEARIGRKKLRVEVKGSSQDAVYFELTPNEYSKLQQFKESYRISVLTNALTDNKNLNIFLFSDETGKWENDSGETLTINEKVSAAMSL
ncbi:MAG: DUF3883 domain-containing protein [Deltaproteobacteria bacterium]|nr:DUF3883 domain-containing protein [Deltaproteobacteria bacterium]